jgi:hypothetical protein
MANLTKHGHSIWWTWLSHGHLALVEILSFITDVIFKFENLKRKPTKSKWIMPHLKLSKFLLLGQKNWKTNKICNSYEIMKNGQILTIQKSLTIKWLRFSNKTFLIWVYHLVLHYILSPNNKFGLWINIKFSILWCSNKMINPYFLISKIHYY